MGDKFVIFTWGRDLKSGEIYLDSFLKVDRDHYNEEIINSELSIESSEEYDYVRRISHTIEMMKYRAIHQNTSELLFLELDESLENITREQLEEYLKNLDQENLLKIPKLFGNGV